MADSSTSTSTSTSTDKQSATFLLKCYAMVDDPSTDRVISWGSLDTSFVIWDIIAFQQELLPKYFKHNNLSSFVRQLNQYGFKKYDPDRLEFTNDGFIKGQKHILKNITRKKSSQGNYQQNLLQESNTTRRKSSRGNCQQDQSQENTTCTVSKSSNSQQNQSQENSTLAAAGAEVVKFELWKDVESLKMDKNVVVQELAKLRHHQQGADGKLQCLGERLQGMEISQQQMLSFLAMVVQSPGFMAQLLQQNESNWRISETSKKRSYLALEQDNESNDPFTFDGQIVRYQPLENVASDGQIVRYQPLENEMPKHLVTPMPNSDGSQHFDPTRNGLDDFFRNIDMVPTGEGMAMQMEENGHPENEGQHIIPYLLEDGMTVDNLLLDNIETTEPNSLGDEPSQALDQLMAELGLLVSDTNNKDQEKENNFGDT